MEQSLIVFLDWNVDRLNMRKGPNKLVILSIFILIIPLGYRIQLFRRGLRRDVSVHIGLFVKVICCTCDHFFMRHIDGKYR